MNHTIHNKRYYQWLVEQIDIYNGIYSNLIETLYSTPYKSTIMADSIRMRKAMELRKQFTTHCPTLTNEIAGDINCLEILVSLARDAENVLMRDGDKGDRTSLWFWDMITNLGLMDQTNDMFDEVKVNKKLSRFVTRRYRKNGIGSIGRTRTEDTDFRRMDVWKQLNIWIFENKIDKIGA